MAFTSCHTPLSTLPLKQGLKPISNQTLIRIIETSLNTSIKTRIETRLDHPRGPVVGTSLNTSIKTRIET